MEVDMQMQPKVKFEIIVSSEEWKKSGECDSESGNIPERLETIVCNTAGSFTWASSDATGY